ncbi:MAG: homoserine kinase [Bacteroidales bacterium]|nr:homoserine kinase [Bacteroidales bacterium]MCF8404626.1 homoserine kinase [Bacteroidales bacterium]
MRSVTVKGPATSANVGPGYDIFALALEYPYDEIQLSLTDSKGIKIEVINNIQNIPTDPKDNTAGLAASELLNAKKIDTGLLITIGKKISSGGGMGTTGASAAATVFGLNYLFDLKMSNNEMIDFARRGEVASGGSPHADNVAAALLGGFVLVKDYNPIDVLKLELPRIPVVISAITKSQRTTRGFITYEIGQEKLKAQMARCSRIIHAIHTADLVEFGKALSVDYIHEPVRGAAIPGYWGIKDKVIEMGAYGCTISGGGSSVIAFCPEERQKEIADYMDTAFSSNPSYKTTIQTFTSNQGVQII